MTGQNQVSALLLLLSFVSGASAVSAHAAMPDNQYLAALKIANAKVARQHTRTRTLSALVLAPLSDQLSGRIYKTGDTWEVVAFPLMTPIMAKNSAAGTRETRTGAGVVLSYKVLSSEPGKTRILITPIERLGLKPQNGAAGRTVELVLDAEYRTISETFSGPPAPSRTSVLELLPLTLPDLQQADPVETAAIGELPQAVIEFAHQHGLSLEQTGGRAYEAEDPFGRGISLAWAKGALWPSFIRTQNGVAFLLQETL